MYVHLHPSLSHIAWREPSVTTLLCALSQVPRGHPNPPVQVHMLYAGLAGVELAVSLGRSVTLRNMSFETAYSIYWTR